MSGKRTKSSLSIPGIILLLSGGLTMLILAFIFGVMVGKGDINIPGFEIPVFEKDVKSPAVKMKIESSPMQQQPDVKAANHSENPVVMNNITSKPVITFYDTLSKPHAKEAPAAKIVSDRKKENREKPSRKVFTVQAGAMKDKRLAEEVVAKLKRKGYSASISASESGKGTWYRVRTGTFSNKEEARREASRIERNEGISTTVVEK